MLQKPVRPSEPADKGNRRPTKEVKKTGMLLMLFRGKCKELVKIITEAKDNLWTQVTEAEAKEKMKKKSSTKRNMRSSWRLNYCNISLMKNCKKLMVEQKQI